MKQRSTTVRKNEKSWAIELISQINTITDKNDLILHIRKAMEKNEFIKIK